MSSTTISKRPSISACELPAKGVAIRLNGCQIATTAVLRFSAYGIALVVTAPVSSATVWTFSRDSLSKYGASFWLVRLTVTVAAAFLPGSLASVAEIRIISEAILALVVQHLGQW